MKNYLLKEMYPTHYVIHDTTDKKEFPVAKKGLSPKYLKKIEGLQKFDVGGTVQGRRPENLDIPYVQTPEPTPETSPVQLSPQEAGLEAYKQAVAQPGLAGQNAYGRFGASVAGAMNPNQREKLAEDQGMMAKNYVENQQNSKSIDNAQSAEDLAARNKNRSELGLPPLPGSEMPQPSPTPGASPISFQPPQQVQGENPMQQSLAEYNKAFGQEQGANTAIGQAQSQRAQAESQTQTDFQSQMKQIHDDYKKQFDLNQQKQDEINADIQKNPINADRYWNNKSTAGKVSSIIGLLLGGAGSGGNASNNAAANALDAAINRDIKAQQDNMTQKNNLLGYYMKQYGNLQQAQMQTKSDLLSVTQAKLNQIAAQSNDPIAKQNAILQNSQISLQKANLNHQLAMQSAIYGSSDPLTAKIALGLQGEEQKRALDEKGSFETHQKALSNIKQLYQQSNADESFVNYALHPIDTERKVAVLNAGISDAMLSTDAAKRMSPEVQQEMLKPYQIRLTDSKEVRGAKLMGALQKINTFAPPTPLLSGLGWLPSNRGPANFRPK
jgi:hypothetical protein